MSGQGSLSWASGIAPPPGRPRSSGGPDRAASLVPGFQALSPRAPRAPTQTRDPSTGAGPSAAAAAAAALALRLPPSPGAAAPIGYLREGRSLRSPASGPAARHSRSGPPPQPSPVRGPSLHGDPSARALLNLLRPGWLLPRKPGPLAPTTPGATALPNSARLESLARGSFSHQREGGSLFPLFPRTPFTLKVPGLTQTAA